MRALASLALVTVLLPSMAFAGHKGKKKATVRHASPDDDTALTAPAAPALTTAPAAPTPAMPPASAAPAVNRPSPVAAGAAAGTPARSPSVSVKSKPVAMDSDVGVRTSKPVDLERPLVDFEVGPELGMRDFRYGQAASTGLRPYTNPGMAMVSASVNVFPFAESRTAIARDIGLTAGAGRSLFIHSTGAQAGKSVDGSWTRYHVGALARIHLGDPPHAPWLGLEATYGDSLFTFNGDDPSVVDAPSVDYRFLRGGADLTVPVGRVSLLGGAGYRRLMLSGQIAQRFPRANGNGFDAHVGAAFRLNKTFDVRGSAEYIVALIDPNSRTGDQFMAGRALDQYTIFQLGVSAFLF
jgi:hypothetical protein